MYGLIDRWIDRWIYRLIDGWIEYRIDIYTVDGWCMDICYSCLHLICGSNLISIINDIVDFLSIL